MRKTDEINNPDSCFNRAKPQEHMFNLLGRDVAAPAAIRHWCNKRVELGKNSWRDDQIVSALAIADEIEAEHVAAQGNAEMENGGGTYAGSELITELDQGSIS